MNLYTAFYDSPIGLIKLQASDKYIKAALFAEASERKPDDETKLLKLASRQLDEYFSGKRRNFNLPLNQDGTAFQEKIWDLLAKVPYGNTISYQTLAHRYGDLKAIRAAASANGKNSLSIIIPCHRVIGSNQSLVGYAGGLWRKRWLLAHEAKHHHGVQELSFEAK